MQDEKDTLRQQLLTLQSEALAQVEQADGLEALEQIRIDYLGKKGKLSKILGGMGKLPPEERPAIGALANTFKEALQSSLEQRKQALGDSDDAPGVTAPHFGFHAHRCHCWLDRPGGCGGHGCPAVGGRAAPRGGAAGAR